MDTQSSPKSTDTSCVNGNCKDCLKGGLPVKKESLTFFLLASFAATMVLFVLFVNAKRELSVLQSKAESALAQNTTASPSAYPIPKERKYTQTIALPKPVTDGKMSLEKAIVSRRTRREFSDVPVTLSEISQMLWSGQGISDAATGKRTVPSARESYSMTLFVFVKSAEGIQPGLYEYLPKENALAVLPAVDVETVMKTAGVQEGAQKAPVVFLVSSALGAYQAKTKATDVNATYMEAGHIGQNMYLQAESLGMATVTMAGFSSAKLTSTLGMDPALTVEYILPFGHRVTSSATVKE